MVPELLAFLKENFESIDRRFEQNALQFEALRTELGTFREAAEHRFNAVDETNRHTRVLLEALQPKIELVAEGVTGANERIDALRKETKEDNAELRTLMTLSVTDLSKRVRVLEAREPSRPTSRRKA